MDECRWILNELYGSPQLRRAAVQVGGGCTYAAVASKRFQNMDGCTLVG